MLNGIGMNEEIVSTLYT